MVGRNSLIINAQLRAGCAHLEALTSILNLLDGLLGSAQYFPFLLLGTGLYLTVYLKFPANSIL